MGLAPVHRAAPTLPLSRRFVAALVLAHLLAVLALAASPRLHHWLHPDEDDDDGDCAVVLFLHGGCDQAPAPLALPACIRVWQATAAIAAGAVRVPCVFAVCGILEHAPPSEVRSPIVSFSAVA